MNITQEQWDAPISPIQVLNLLMLPIADTTGFTIDYTNDVQTFEVDFEKRGRWFTPFEQEQLAQAGMISAFGLSESRSRVRYSKKEPLPNGGAYSYNNACCGKNNLYLNETQYINHLKSFS